MTAEQRFTQGRALAAQLRDRHGALRAHVGQARGLVDAEAREALLALAAIYLPTLEPAALRRVAELTGFLGFDRRDPIAAREHERKVLQTSIRRFEEDARFRDRVRLVGDQGELSQALIGAQEGLAHAQVPCDRFERQDGFLALVAAHYDTPQFAVGWWRAEYWKLWAAGDRICRELGLDDFGDDVLPAYRRVAEPRDVWRGEVERLSAEVGAIHELVRQRDEAAYRLQHLDASFLEQSHAYLADHLAQADLGLLGEWSARAEEPDRGAILGGLHRLDGVRAKLGFLGDIEGGIGQADSQLAARIGKYDRKLAKLRRGKHLGASELADNLPDKAPGIAAQADKTQQRVDRLVAARNYDAFGHGSDSHLWWWHFTEAPPTRLCPHTRGWYETHPDAVAGLHRDPEAAAEPDGVAAAFMSGRDPEAGGSYLS